jgi:2-polyprenyl-6-methoxyphenol hydroxylase-like FAD-dependent oxidoreductase
MFDVAVIGGSFAGPTAALQLGRASRRTIVLDAGGLQNRLSPMTHGVPALGRCRAGRNLVRFRADWRGGLSVGMDSSDDEFTLDIAGAYRRFQEPSFACWSCTATPGGRSGAPRAQVGADVASHAK